MALPGDQQSEKGTPAKSLKTESPPPSGKDTPEGVNKQSTVPSTTDSTRGSLSNISSSSIKHRTDNGCDDDSSAFDSSSDTECDDDSIKRAIDRIPGALVPGEARILPNGDMMVGPETFNPGIRPPAGPSPIGAVAINHSSDITFGNKTYIKGQVVIKNIYQDRKNGCTNGGFNPDEKDSVSSSATKKVPPASIPPEPRTWQSSLKTLIKDKPLLSIVVMITLMIVVCAILAVIFIFTASGKASFRPPVGDGDDDRPNVPQDKDIEDDLFPDPRPLRIVPRTEWLAQPPRENLVDLKLPVNNIIIAHTATDGCTTQQACSLVVQSIQRYHMDTTKYGDIGYNFLVGGDGRVYEGRGWLKMGAHTKDYNSISQGIAFIGNYETVDKPTDMQMEQLEALLRNGTDGEWVGKDYKLYGASQLKGTLSPGRFLMERLKLLPHFSLDTP